jgi:glycosyltransferase involved in cell wall biosynthesis
VLAGSAVHRRRHPVLAETWLVGPLGNVARARRSVGGRLALRLLRRADALLCSTQVGINELLAAGQPADRVVQTRLELDLQRWPPRRSGETTDARQAPDGAPGRIVYAGRFDLRQKRLDLLLAGWGQAGTDWELLLIGAGPDEQVVADLASGCGGQVRVQGWSDDVGAELRSAEAFVLPTEFESPGYALLEGMACGLPGLASDIDVYRDLQPEGVRLVASTPADWSAGLRWLVGMTAGERADLGRSARAWVERNVGDGAAQIATIIDR